MIRSQPCRVRAATQSVLLSAGTSSSTTLPSSSILWGAAAAALAGWATSTALEERQRRKEEEEQQRRQAEAEASRLNAAESARKAQEWQAGQNILEQQEAGLAAYYDARKLGEAEAAQKAELAEQQTGLQAYYDGRKAGEAQQAKQTVAAKVLAMPVKQDDPPKGDNWFLNLFKSKGEKLIDPATALEVLSSPDLAAMKTYIAAAINVQNDGIDRDKDNDDSHLGPAQLSRNELNTTYGEGFGRENGEYRGYGLGLPGTDPLDNATAVNGMNNRIQQVMDDAGKLAEKNGLTLDETDKFIIAALSQNGGGFDKNDIQNVVNNKKYTNSGEIDWQVYFDDKYGTWLEKESTRELTAFKTWQIWKTGSTKDWDTEFMLELFYKQAIKLEGDGYYLPENLDTNEIERLMNTSETIKSEGK